MIGTLAGMAGGGGMSASSSASSGQDVSNSISTGTINVGGLDMGGKPLLDRDAKTILVIGGIVLGAVWMLRKK